MKRFITVNKKEIDEVLIVVRNAAITSVANDAYNWLKKQLQAKQVSHNDQNANHHSELPHQGGYASFYVDAEGKWFYVEHWQEAVFINHIP